MSMGDLISVLNYFGLTPATITPLVVVGGVGIFFVFKHTRPIRDDVKNIRERLPVIESRVGDLWADKIAPAHSPRQLNERGQTILNQSGIKEFVERNKPELLRRVRERNCTNAYDAEKATFSVVNETIKEAGATDLDSLKNGAYKVGATLDTLLLVGGIYLRNLIFPELGFSLDDIDKHNPDKKQE